MVKAEDPGIFGEHPLNLGGVGGPGQREHQQHARFDRREILAGDRAAGPRRERGRAAPPRPRSSPRRGGAIRPLPVRVVVTTNTPFFARVDDAVALRAAGRAGAGGRDDDALRAAIDGGLDQIAVGALVDQDHVDARQLRRPR